jgi:hypothetical protein
MKFDKAGMFSRKPLRPQILAMHPGSVKAGKIQMETFGIRHLELSRKDFDFGINLRQLLKGIIPEFIKISGSGIHPLIFFQLFKRHVNNRHYRIS